MEPDAVRQRCAEDLDGAAFYTGLERRGVDIGETFRSVDRLWRGSGEALGRVMLPGGRAGGPSPAAQLLDGCLQCCLGVRAATGADDDAAYIVTRIEGVSLAAPDGVAEGARPAFWAHAQQRPERDPRAERMVVDVRIFDEARRFVGSVDGVHLRRAGKAALARLRSGGPDWHYEVAWEERPRAAGAARTSRAQALASPASIAARLDGRRSDEEKGRDADGAAAVLAELEALASQYARLALARLGFEQHAADAADAEALAARLGVAPRHTRLLRRVVEIASAGASEGVAAGADVGELAARAARLAERHPEHRAAIELLARCGAHLADVLRGDVDPLHLLFSSSAGATAETLYREEVSLRASNALVAESIAAALDGVAAGQAARILEIGAGTGATTDAVIERLPAGAAEYVFTDVTSGFVNAARDRLGRHAFMRFERLDIEASTESRPDAGTYDVVLAANVLHATQSLRETLDNVRHLLAPGGLLILLETTEPRAWVDLVFGMTEGWWRFRDVERRPAHPLLAHEGWVAVLADAGFEEPTAIAPARAAVLPQTLLLARAPIARPAAHGDRDRDGADPRRAGEGKRERPAACWAVFSTGSAPGREVARLLRDGGDECVLVSPGAEDGGAEPDHVRIRPGHAADYERAMRAALDRGKRLAGAVVLWPAERAVDGEPVDATDRAALDCLHLLHVVRALAGATDEAKLWIVTAGAQPAGGGSEPLSPSQAALWGLGRSIASRYPRHWGGLVDLPPGELQPRDAAALVAELREPDGEDQIAYRGGRRRVARLVRAAGPDAAPPALSARATYLVTGGLGGVGRKVARWLVDRGARHLVLTGRTALPPAGSLPETSPDDELLARLAAVRELEARGATVEVVAVDVADRAAMAELLERIRAGGRPLRGVVHAAADIRPQPLDQLDDAALRSMLGPKAGGAWTLHALTRELDLDFFVLFSSTTSLLGSPELAHYAAANQFLGALAHQRAAEGLPALAIDWGTWDVMRTFSVEEQEAVARSGQNKMDAARALDAMGRLIGQGVVQRVVADLDWSVLRPMYEARRRSAFLERMVAAGRGQVVPAAPRAGAPRAGALVERIANSRPSEAHAIVQAFVEDGVRRILGLGEAEPIDAEKGLFDMGMDSLMSIQLKGELELGVGEPLPATLTLNYPSVRALADYLADRFAGRRAPDADRVTREEAAIADGDADDELVAEIARLSDEESARLLLEELSGLAIDADEPVDR